MADNFGHVSAGTPLEIAAETWNQMLEVARLAKRDRLGKGGGDPLISDVTPSCTIFVQNNSGQTLPQFAVLAVSTVLTAFDAVGAMEARRRPVLAGSTPSSSGNAVVITTEPIPNGYIGQAVIAGVAVGWVQINSSSDQYAAPIAGNLVNLTSGSSGPARILWTSSTVLTSGIYLCVLLLDNQTYVNQCQTLSGPLSTIQGRIANSTQLLGINASNCLQAYSVAQCSSASGSGSTAVGSGGGAAPGPVPVAPTLNTPSVGSGQVSLTWSSVTFAASYVVWVSTSSSFSSYSAYSGSSTSGTITGLTNGTPYYFLVFAISNQGVDGVLSNVVSATPTGLPAALVQFTASTQGTTTNGTAITTLKDTTGTYTSSSYTPTVVYDTTFSPPSFKFTAGHYDFSDITFATSGNQYAYTFTGWFYCTSTSLMELISTGAAGNSFEVILNYPSVGQISIYALGIGVICSTTFTSGSWNFFAAVYGGTSANACTIYCNGGAGVTGDGDAATNNLIGIGYSKPQNTYAFTGFQEDMRIYNSGLTSAQAGSLYTAGRG